tara:strand:+ start:268 stop:462 length:195 start_codon:yes stop_codon:yes gene_type:complete
MDYNFNFNINVSIWGNNGYGNTIDQEIEIIPGSLSKELQDKIRNELDSKIYFRLSQQQEKELKK